MKLLPLIIFTIVLFAANNVLAISDSANVQLQVVAECNNNGRCEPERFETEENCYNDCRSAIGGPGEPSFYIKDIIVSRLTFHSADISWQTTRPTQCALFWGQTGEYEKEIISETNFKQDHFVVLDNLHPSSAYHFKITCKDHLNYQAGSQDRSFETLALVPNVRNFRAVPGDEKIILTWLNPEDANFRGVRLVRNNNFYPSHIEDGIIVYEGEGVSFTDLKLQNGKIYYYTVFAFGKQQNYSSGAIVSAVPQATIAPPPPPLPPEFPPLPPDQIGKLNFNDFDFYWEKGKILLKNGKTVEIEEGKLLIISIGYKKVPSICKTFMAELEAEKEHFSYLFEINKETNAYNTAFFPPEEQGFYPLTIKCLDNDNKIAIQAKGEIEVYKKPKPAPLYRLFNWSIFINFILIILLIILLLMLILLMLKRENQESKK